MGCPLRGATQFRLVMLGWFSTGYSIYTEAAVEQQQWTVNIYSFCSCMSWQDFFNSLFSRTSNCARTLLRRRTLLLKGYCWSFKKWHDSASKKTCTNMGSLEKTYFYSKNLSTQFTAFPAEINTNSKTPTTLTPFHTIYDYRGRSSINKDLLLCKHFHHITSSICLAFLT